MDNGSFGAIPGWLATAVLSVVGALSSAVVFMYRLGEQRGQQRLDEITRAHAEEIEELKAARDEREQLRVELAAAKVRLEMLENGDK